MANHHTRRVNPFNLIYDRTDSMNNIHEALPSWVSIIEHAFTHFAKVLRVALLELLVGHPVVNSIVDLIEDNLRDIPIEVLRFLTYNLGGLPPSLEVRAIQIRLQITISELLIEELRQSFGIGPSFRREIRIPADEIIRIID